MKKNLFVLTALLVFFVSTSFSQFSVGFTNAGNVITFKLRPVATTTTGFSDIEFFVRYPTNSATFTYGAPVANTADFPAMTALGTTSSGSWEIEHDNPAYTSEGYHVDHILYTAPAPTTTTNTYNANQVYNVVSFPVIGTDATAVINFELVHQDPETSFYLSISDQNGGDLRPATLTEYFFPTTSQAAGPAGSTIYYSGLAVPLPVKFLGFDAIRKDNNAILNWQIENESSLTSRYEVERSFNGTDFKKVNTVTPKNNGKSTNSYDIADLNLSQLRKSGVFYYRIRQVDKDGKYSFSNIKSVRLNSNGIVIGVYPNPIKNVANLAVDVESDAVALVSIMDASGKQVQSNQWQLFKGANIKHINVASLAAGSYLLKVQTESEIKTATIVKTN